MTHEAPADLGLWVRSHRRLILRFVNRRFEHLSKDEAWTMALWEIWRAVQNYNPAKGATFETYAMARVRYRMQYPGRQRKKVPSISLEAYRDQDGDRFLAIDMHRENESADVLWERLSKLPERWRQVLTLRFGLAGEPMDLSEVGEAMGISKQRAQQIEANAIARLRYHYGLPEPKGAA